MGVKVCTSSGESFSAGNLGTSCVFSVVFDESVNPLKKLSKTGNLSYKKYPAENRIITTVRMVKNLPILLL